jgi:hypothetical protein
MMSLLLYFLIVIVIFNFLLLFGSFVLLCYLVSQCSVSPFMGFTCVARTRIICHTSHKSKRLVSLAIKCVIDHGKLNTRKRRLGAFLENTFLFIF